MELLRSLVPAAASSAGAAPDQREAAATPDEDIRESHEDVLNMSSIPWHQLNLDGLEGIATPFQNVQRADRTLAKHRSILQSCSRLTLQSETDEATGGAPKLVRGLTRSNVKEVSLKAELLSLNGNPLSELRSAPLFGDLHEYSVGRAVRLYLRLQLEMSTLFFLLFALAGYGVYDSSKRNTLRNECRRALDVDFDDVVYNQSSPIYAKCGFEGNPIRPGIAQIPSAWNPATVLMMGPLTWAVGACEEFTNATYYTQPVPSLVTTHADVFVSIPTSDICGGKNESTHVAYWLSMLQVLVVIVAIVMLRSRAVSLAMHDDAARWTAADYAVLLRGLRDGLDAKADSRAAKMAASLLHSRLIRGRASASAKTDAKAADAKAGEADAKAGAKPGEASAPASSASGGFPGDAQRTHTRESSRLEARELHACLKHDLNALGFGGKQIVQIEVGRKCRAEIKVLKRLDASGYEQDCRFSCELVREKHGGGA